MTSFIAGAWNKGVRDFVEAAFRASGITDWERHVEIDPAFVRPAEGGGFVLFPTVAHSHRERTRPEHHDLLAPGDADVHDVAAVRQALNV